MQPNRQLGYMEPKDSSRPLRCRCNEGKKDCMNQEENYTARL